MSSKLSGLPFVWVLLLLPGWAYADPVTIKFDDLSKGEIVHSQYLSQGLRISAVNWSHGPDHAVVFDTIDVGDSSDEDLEAPFDATSTNDDDLWPGNVLILHERHDCDMTHCETPDDEGSRPAGWLEFDFAVPTTLHGMTIIDVNYQDGEVPARLILYDSSGGLLETIDVPGVYGQGNWRPWEIEASGVSRARLYLPGDAAIDDFSFTPESTVNWKPEFASFPPVAVAPGEVYRYLPDVVDRDGDGDSIQLELVSAPEGMVLTNTGLLEWNTGEHSGRFSVILDAADEQNATTRQVFEITVSEEFTRIQDFEFPVGTIVDDELLVDGLHVSAGNLSSGSDYAVVFDTGAPTGGDNDLAAPFEEGANNELGLGPMSPGKVLVLHEEHDCDVQGTVCNEPDDETTHPAGWMDFSFTQPAHVYSIDVFDITSDNPAARTIELFDIDGQQLPIDLVIPRTGSNDWGRLIIDTGNVGRMRLHLDGDGAIDRLHYALVGQGAPENRKPRVNTDTYITDQDEILVIAAPGVLGNDSDPDGDSLSAGVRSEPLHGQLLLNLDGGFTYTPELSFSGQDQFEYSASDGELEDYATVSITVDGLLQSAIIDEFSSTASTIPVGDQVTLSWATRYADLISIFPGYENLAASGSINLAPAATTQYTLSAAGNDGVIVSQALTITVTDPEPEPEPEPEPDPDPEPSGLIIDFYWPDEGDGVNWLTPPIALEIVQQTVMGVDPGSTQIIINGELFPVECGYDGNQFVTCSLLAELTVGNHFVTARVADYVGDYSNTVTLNFYIDVTPPPPPDPTKLSATSTDSTGWITVTGHPGAAIPGNTVQVQSGSMVANDLVIGSDGSFSTRMRASVGDEVTVRMRDGAGNYSDSVILIVPAPAPVIAIASPSGGELLNSNRPETVISYVEPGAGIDFSSLSLSTNGAVMAADCSHEADISRCTPTSELLEGANTVTAIVSDINAFESNITEVMFYVDTVPPEPPVEEKISLTLDAQGRVSIMGAPGAVEASAAVIVQHAGIEYQADSGSLGEFSFMLDAVTGDEIRITAMDAAGNRSEEAVFVVPAAPIQVEIISPYDGENIMGSRVRVHGTHDGEYGTGISVNGHPAAVTSDGSFFRELDLAPGNHQIAVTATALSGSTSTQLVSITTTDAPPSPVTLTATEPQGVASHETGFELRYHGDPDATRVIELDYDGNGEVDYVTMNPFDELSYEFDSPGVYYPTATLYLDGATFEATTTVVVEDVNILDAFLRAQFAQFVEGLQEGDQERAMAILSPGAQKRFEPLFEQILPVIQQNLPSWQPPKPIQINGRFAEYLVLRNNNGTQYGFPVTFQRMPDGTWKLTNL